MGVEFSATEVIMSDLSFSVPTFAISILCVLSPGLPPGGSAKVVIKRRSVL